jgi:hypothetical protein
MPGRGSKCAIIDYRSSIQSDTPLAARDSFGRTARAGHAPDLGAKWRSVPDDGIHVKRIEGRRIELVAAVPHRRDDSSRARASASSEVESRGRLA